MSQRPVNEIIEHAKTQLGNSEYYLLLDNCQHFFTDCRYDKRESAEIRNITRTFYIVYCIIKIIEKFENLSFFLPSTNTFFVNIEKYFYVPF